MRQPLLVATALAVRGLAVPGLARAEKVTIVSSRPFAQVVDALEKSIARHGLTLVCHANAQRGAAARGVAIKGNQVLMIFRNDLAGRFEVPIRVYLYENPDGTATVSYIRPTSIFALYRHPRVQAWRAPTEKPERR